MSFNNLENNCLITVVSMLDDRQIARVRSLNKHWNGAIKNMDDPRELRMREFFQHTLLTRSPIQSYQYSPGCIDHPSMIVGKSVICPARGAGFAPSIQVNCLDGQLIVSKLPKIKNGYIHLGTCGNFNILQARRSIRLVTSNGQASLFSVGAVKVYLFDRFTGTKVGKVITNEQEQKLQNESELVRCVPQGNHEMISIFNNGRVAKYEVRGSGVKSNAYCTQTAQLDQSVAKKVFDACLFGQQPVLLCEMGSFDNPRRCLMSLDLATNQASTLIQEDPHLIAIAANTRSVFALYRRKIAVYRKTEEDVKEGAARLNLELERDAKELGAKDNMHFRSDYFLKIDLFCNDRFVAFNESEMNAAGIFNSNLSNVVILSADTLNLQMRITGVNYHLNSRVSFYDHDTFQGFFRCENQLDQTVVSIYDLEKRTTVSEKAFPVFKANVNHYPVSPQIAPLPNSRGFVVYQMVNNRIGPFNRFRHVLSYIGPVLDIVKPGCCS